MGKVKDPAQYAFLHGRVLVSCDTSVRGLRLPTLITQYSTMGHARLIKARTGRPPARFEPQSLRKSPAWEICVRTKTAIGSVITPAEESVREFIHAWFENTPDGSPGMVKLRLHPQRPKSREYPRTVSRGGWLTAAYIRSAPEPREYPRRERLCEYSSGSSSRRDAVNLAQDFSPGTALRVNDLVP
jgi:hypothetical protein